MTSKTIALTGAEIKAEYSGGANAWLRNDGADVVYASAAPGIVAGADGVVSILAGQAAVVYGANGTVYLLGTGSAMLIGSDYAECPFKVSTSSGGSGADEVARAAITAHAGNADIHVVAAEKSGWNGLSNPNLLGNPDFAVNQRGQTSYEQSGSPVVRTVDRWATLIQGTKVDITSSGIKLGFTSTAAAATVIGQTIEGTSLAGRTVTFSVCVAEQTAQHGKLSVNYLSGGERKYNLVDLDKVGVTSITVSIPAGATDIRAWIYGADIRVGDTADSYTTVAWAKLEIGSAATPFVPPDPAAELAKCQRFFVALPYGEYSGCGNVITSSMVGLGIPLCTTMRAVPELLNTNEMQFKVCTINGTLTGRVNKVSMCSIGVMLTLDCSTSGSINGTPVTGSHYPQEGGRAPIYLSAEL